MNLLEIQHRMLNAVMQPLTNDEQMQPHTRDGRSMHDVAAEFIKPNDRLSSFERLEIYNRHTGFAYSPPWTRTFEVFGRSSAHDGLKHCARLTLSSVLLSHLLFETSALAWSGG